MTHTAPAIPSVRADWTFPVWTVALFVITLAIQAGVFVYSYGALNQRLVSVEEKMREIGATPETVARLDERTKAMQEDLGDIKRRLGPGR